MCLSSAWVESTMIPSGDAANHESVVFICIPVLLTWYVGPNNFVFELYITASQPPHVTVLIVELEQYLVVGYTVWSLLTSQSFCDALLQRQIRMQSVMVF